MMFSRFMMPMAFSFAPVAVLQSRSTPVNISSVYALCRSTTLFSFDPVLAEAIGNRTRMKNNAMTTAMRAAQPRHCHP
jgi:hypothetical protein